MKKKRILYVSILTVVTLLSVLIANRFFTTPSNSELSEVEILRGSGNHEDLVEYYMRELSSHPDSVELHRSLIESHNAINTPFSQASIDHYYESLNSAGYFPDICRYAKGYRFAVSGYADSAIFYYRQVENSSLPFLQNSLGRAYADIEEDSLAIVHFLKSLAAGDNPEFSAYHLSKLFYKTGQYEKLNTLINDEYLSNYVSLRIRRFSHMKNREYGKYLRNFAYVNFGNIVPEGFLAGVLILLVWIGYLVRIDIFQKKKSVLFLTVFILGALFSLGCTILYDLFDLQFDLKLNGSYLNDLLFSIVGIGLIEESVKIAPLLILFLTKKRYIDEPLDYIVLASLSALGFAFMENIGYFHIYGLNTIFARAQSASLLHMFFTVLPIYGVIRAIETGKNRYCSFLSYFALSVVVHGIYDFFLVGEKGVDHYRQLAPVILIISIVLFKRVILHMLNISKSYDMTRLNKLNHLSYYLGYSLFSVFILQFFIVANRFGSSAAIDSLPANIYTSLFPLFVIPTILGKFVICKGYLPSLISPKQFRIPRELLLSYCANWKEYSRFQKRRPITLLNGRAFTAYTAGKLLLTALYITGTVATANRSVNIPLILTALALYSLFSLLLILQTLQALRTLSLKTVIDFSKEEITFQQGKRKWEILFSDIKRVKLRGPILTVIYHGGRASVHTNNRKEPTLFHHHFTRYLLFCKESRSGE